MNTKSKQEQKNNQRQKTRQEQGPKKRGQNPGVLHEHEYPELRMTR
jgi:hypothetical protein